MSVWPLPMRDGLGPLRIVLSAGAVVDGLAASHPGIDWAHKLSRGDVVDRKGRRYSVDATVNAGAVAWSHVDPAPEPRVPFDISIIHRDERVIVIDKPHFLSTMPRGQHVRETALVRLRALTGIETLVPAHRLDRMTAGVLLFVIEPADRAAYHDLFATGDVTKTYEAVADYRPELTFPQTVRTRIFKEHGVMVAEQFTDEPNSETRVELVERRSESALYRLRPITGKTHQLRLHMAHLGIAIHGDNYYPEYRPEREPTFTNPLQLLAKTLTFTDPIDGKKREFHSAQALLKS